MTPPVRQLYLTGGVAFFMRRSTSSQKLFQLYPAVLLKLLQPLGKALCAGRGIGVLLLGLYAVHHLSLIHI